MTRRKNLRIPPRAEIAESDRWDLSSLFKTDTAWEQTLPSYKRLMKKLPSHRGTLATSAQALAAYLRNLSSFFILEERLAAYCHLRASEDEAGLAARDMRSRFTSLAARAAALRSWDAPEIRDIPDKTMAAFLRQDCLAEYRVYLENLLRRKPYLLSDKEERLLALCGETKSAYTNVYTLLTAVDFSFGHARTSSGEKPLSLSNITLLLEDPSHTARKRIWEQFYTVFGQHKTALGGLYAAQVKQNTVYARARGFASAREEALFDDAIPLSVYENLIATVSANLAPLHRYYELRRRALKRPRLAHWDLYAPIVPAASPAVPWDTAVTLVTDALAPLGGEYTSVLREGLRGRWADRYENAGKRGGAFAAGCYAAGPFILMNYKEDSARELFTLAHESGHAMHTWYSRRANPVMRYQYSLFEAEVASTFNEDLLFRHLLKTAPSAARRAAITGKRLDDIIATLYRQTMFAEFERNVHALEEEGEALSGELLSAQYRALLEKYLGPAVLLNERSGLEYLRIPHFYRAFYVYQYATGISAALALSRRVLEGGARERSAYQDFLRSGGSRHPVDSLKEAGVDMSKKAPVEAACACFAALVDEFEALLPAARPAPARKPKGAASE